MRIQHNIPAMSSYRNYTNNVNALKKNLERLSSGYKINRAGDDAAGLAISEKMRAQITGLEVAQKNAKDGISLVQTAEGALTEVHDMLNRMFSLAEQSANGTYDNEVDRLQLNKEVAQLKDEINRIADSSNFNGIKLLDGSMDAESTAKADLQAAADAAKQAAADALANADNATGEIVFGKETAIDLPAQATDNKPSTTGAVETILETDFKATDKPGFSMELDGMSHVFKNPADTSTTGDKFIEIKFIGKDGSPATGAVKISEKNIADAYKEITGEDAKAGDTATAEMLAKAAENYFNGMTAINRKIEGNEYTAKADGSRLVFEIKGDATDKVPNITIQLKGVKAETMAAKNHMYVTAKYTAGSGATAAETVRADVKVKLADGSEVTFSVDKLSSNLATKDLIKKLGEATQKIDGKDVKLEDLFDITQTSNKITFKAKTAGAAQAAVTDMTLTDAAAANKASLAAQTDTEKKLCVEGSDAYEGGTFGYANVASTVTIQSGAPAIDQLASTTITLDASKVVDGAALRLGDQTYVFSIGEDSKYKNAENVVRVDDLVKGTDYDEADGKITLKTEGLEKMLDKLAEVAKNNETFSVGHRAGKNGSLTAGEITVKQLAAVKDSTDMSTMEKLKSYIGLTTVDEKATAANTAAAVEAAKADAAKLQEKADALQAKADKAIEGKSLTLQIGDTAEDFNQMVVNVKDCHTYAMKYTAAEGAEGYLKDADGMTLDDIDLGSQEGAAKAMAVIKNAINYVSDVRGTLGATQNRLDHTINNLSVMTENIQDAESTIRDVDVAAEMMEYTKNNILVQSAQAMLAQANQLPQGVLQLLG